MDDRDSCDAEVEAATRWCDLSRAVARVGMLRMLATRRYVLTTWPGEPNPGAIRCWITSPRVLRALVSHFDAPRRVVGGPYGEYTATVAGMRVTFGLEPAGDRMQLRVQFA